VQLNPLAPASTEPQFSKAGEHTAMTIYDVEFIRHMPGRDEPAVIDIHNVLATGLNEAIRRAWLSLLTINFRIRPEAFRIRENGNEVVF
jgi:hypothetical protein